VLVNQRANAHDAHQHATATSKISSNSTVPSHLLLLLQTPYHIEAAHLTMQLAINTALWITSLVMSFFAATNDVAWYLRAETSGPLMAYANCSVPTLGCIRQAKAAGVSLAQAYDEHYWCRMREEAAKAEKTRAEQEAYDVSVADAFTKAEKYDILVQNPPQSIINTNNNINNIINYNTFNMAPPSECTPPPAAHDIPLHRLTIGEEGFLFNTDEFSTAFKKTFYTTLFLFFAIPILFLGCLLHCCCPTTKRKQNDTPKKEPHEYDAVKERPRMMASTQTQTDTIAPPMQISFTCLLLLISILTNVRRRRRRHAVSSHSLSPATIPV
jgi:hypothetical protein